MEFGVQHVVWNLAHVEHTAQQLRDFHRCGTHQRRTSALAHGHDLVDHGVILLAGCLIDAVVLVVTDNRTVGGNLHHVEFIDVPELTGLRRCRTGHTGELVVHTEIVLQGDGGKGLRSLFHGHVLLGLYGLVQTVAPLTAFHDTARLLIHDLHLTVHHDVFIVAVEHRVGFQQLLERMCALALHGVVAHQLVLLLNLLFLGEVLILQGREFAGDVREHEEFLVVHLLGEPVGTLVGQIHGVEFLFHHEVERFNGLRHAAVVVLHIDFLGAEHTGLDAFLREELDERLVLRQRLVGTVERKETGVEFLLAFLLLAFLHQLVTFGNERLGLREELCGQLALYAHELLHQRLILFEHLVVAIGHRT